MKFSLWNVAHRVEFLHLICSIDGLISGNLHKECQGEPLKACSHDAIFLYTAPFKFTSS